MPMLNATKRRFLSNHNHTVCIDPKSFEYIQPMLTPYIKGKYSLYILYTVCKTMEAVIKIIELLSSIDKETIAIFTVLAGFVVIGIAVLK